MSAGAIAQSILDAASVCLTATTTGAPTTVSLYYTDPPDDCCDALLMFPARYVISEDGIDNAEQRMMPPDEFCLRASTWVMRLLRPCIDALPTPARPIPNRAPGAAGGVALIEDVEAVLCCLPQAIADLDCDPNYTTIRVLPAVPLAALNGCGGWDFRFSVGYRCEACE